MDWANVHVEDEKVAFLSSYNLNHTHLDNQEAITGIRSSHDKMVQATGDDYKTEKALIKEEIETIQKIAEKIFIGLRCDCVEILADDAFEYGEVAATVNYSRESAISS